ncbi:MAG: hypothetical protein UY96_C0004G0019 [Parcubacteria group bacterium GW2011_GWB1_56_8]|nr:MAG: hypothetical protein UY96_C0004G0019 [Parcubacteria group bacterium GW2011_GWB1_56_8]
MLNTKLISIIAAVVVVATLGGYIFWRANQPPIPAGPPSGVDTSSWPTYRNEQYGFEVKYPEDWFNITLENAAGSRSFVEFSNKERTSTGSGVIVVQVVIGSDPDLFNALRNTRADETIEKNLIFYTKIRDETVAGNPAVRYIADYKNVPAGVLPTGEEVLMRRDGAVVYFRIYGYSPLIVKFNQNVFNQILSTFKFTK